MAETKNRIEFGVENLHIAVLNESNNNYETPEKVEGTVQIKLTGKGDSTPLYADNGQYHIITSNTGYEGELEIYNFNDDFKIKYLGFERDGNGVLIEPNILNPKSLALLFKILGDESDRCSVLYKCVFEKPDLEYKTIEDKIDVQVLKIKFKASSKEFENFDKKIIQSSTVNAKLKENWFTQVYIPSKTRTINQ